jgi:erythromycin esterase-like protein
VSDSWPKRRWFSDKWPLLVVALAVWTAVAQEPADWVRKHAIPLQTVEAGHGFDDLQPLAEVVGNARIVALGEATHGTREFFQLKHRLIEFLASQKGFTIFSIEANMPEAYRLNDFVLNGNGDPKQLLKGMYFWTWDTEEVLDMILWMREFNRTGKGRIEFTGFDMQFPNQSIDIVRKFVTARDGHYYITLEPIYQDVLRAAQAQPTQGGAAIAVATFPLEAAAGKHIRYSGYIKTEDVAEGFAGLWWRVDGEKGGHPLAFDNMQDRGAKGTTPWTHYEISLDVPANATNINFGVLHAGSGTAWFDSLQVEIDGKLYTDDSKFDLDFESNTPRGFYTSGDGYEIAPDNSVFHSGKQSLRSKLTSEPQAPNQKISNELLAQGCKSVVDHLKVNRTNFLRAASEEKEVDWAIQNARLVLQYMQLKTGQKTRDESMAENVEWIADQNPGAKLILWAHNGHIGYAAPPGFNPMGGYLHAKFGGDLVNFGFAFNEGSFRAVETGKALREFRIGPAPEGSLDGTLAAAGIPLFALDLRQLPTQGPVGQWFAQPHATRSIGAFYSDADSPSYLANLRWQEAFDVILFVAKTTSARGNR